MTVSEQLKAALLKRQAAGQSLYSISKEAEISYQILSRFLSGERSQIRSETTDKLAAYLGMRLTAPKAAEPPKSRRSR